MMVCTNAKLSFFVHINVCCWADCREYAKVSKPNISFFMNTYSACTVHLYDVSLTANRTKNASLFRTSPAKVYFGLIVQMEHSQSALKTIRILYHLVCHTHYDKEDSFNYQKENNSDYSWTWGEGGGMGTLWCIPRRYMNQSYNLKVISADRCH